MAGANFHSSNGELMLLHEATPENLYFLSRHLFCFNLFFNLLLKKKKDHASFESFHSPESPLMQFILQHGCNVNKLQINVLCLLISEEMCFNIVRSLGSFSVLYFPLREKHLYIGFCMTSNYSRWEMQKGKEKKENEHYVVLFELYCSNLRYLRFMPWIEGRSYKRMEK